MASSGKVNKASDAASNTGKKELSAQEKVQKKLYKLAEGNEKKLQKLKEKFEKGTRKDQEEQRKKELAERKEMALYELEMAETAGEKLKAAGAAMGASLAEAGDRAKKALGSAISGLGDSIEKYFSVYSQYMSQVEARIQGAYSGMSYKSLAGTIKNASAGNPFLRYEDALANLASLVDKGTAVNLTQRAFLATISDKIATTFDAMDDTLLRIVRLQGQDTTASRLGMEAQLTKIFNHYFSDTSYLSQAFDNVTGALIDLTASLDAATAVEFEFITQKWLGALGSSGVDASTLTSIAEAINALGTGDVDYFAGNQAMQNLLVMAANRSGVNYANALTGGLSSTDANNLLWGVVDYIRDVTKGGNNVVIAQYAKLFGLTIADVNAFQSISDQTISDLYQSAMSYSDTLTELNNQLGQVSKRVHISEQIDNMLANVMAVAGTNIASSAGSYLTYKVADMIESITGGIEIPFINVMGFGLDLNMSIEGLIKTGVAGLGLMGSLMSAFSNVLGGESLALGRWTSSYGKGALSNYVGTNKLSTSTSSMGTVANTDESGMQQSVYDEQKQSAEEITGSDADEEPEINVLVKWIKAYFMSGGNHEGSAPLRVAVESMPTYNNFNNRINNYGGFGN